MQVKFNIALHFFETESIPYFYLEITCLNKQASSSKTIVMKTAQSVLVSINFFFSS